jgi:hypothetical protein
MHRVCPSCDQATTELIDVATFREEVAALVGEA